MARQDRVWKTPGDEFWIATDFRSWPLQDGETIVESNARGSLSAVVEDADGNDVTSQIIEGLPLVDMIGDPDPDDGSTPVPPGVRVLVFILAGTAGDTYWMTVTGPSSDGELLTMRFPLEVRQSFYD